MPYFKDNPLEKLVFDADDADSVLDLRGVDPSHAMQHIERLLHEGGHGKRWLIRFDPASSDGRETLFLPLGRRLLAARRAGRLVRCLPASDGAAYFIAFAG